LKLSPKEEEKKRRGRGELSAITYSARASACLSTRGVLTGRTQEVDGRGAARHAFVQKKNDASS